LFSIHFCATMELLPHCTRPKERTLPIAIIALSQCCQSLAKFSHTLFWGAYRQQSGFSKGRMHDHDRQTVANWSWLTTLCCCMGSCQWSLSMQCATTLSSMRRSESDWRSCYWRKTCQHPIFRAVHFFNCINSTINFFNHTFIVFLTHILFVIFFNLFVFRLQVDIIGQLLLNASLLLVLTADNSHWLVQVTRLINNLTMTESFEFWLIIRSTSRNVRFCSCSLLALLVCIFFYLL